MLKQRDIVRAALGDLHQGPILGDHASEFCGVAGRILQLYGSRLYGFDLAAPQSDVADEVAEERGFAARV